MPAKLMESRPQGCARSKPAGQENIKKREPKRLREKTSKKRHMRSTYSERLYASMGSAQKSKQKGKKRGKELEEKRSRKNFFFNTLFEGSPKKRWGGPFSELKLPSNKGGRIWGRRIPDYH